MQKNGPSFSRGTELPLERSYIAPALVQTFTKHSKLYLTAAEAKQKGPTTNTKQHSGREGRLAYCFWASWWMLSTHCRMFAAFPAQQCRTARFDTLTPTWYHPLITIIFKNSNRLAQRFTLLQSWPHCVQKYHEQYKWPTVYVVFDGHITESLNVKLLLTREQK